MLRERQANEALPFSLLEALILGRASRTRLTYNRLTHESVFQYSWRWCPYRRAHLNHLRNWLTSSVGGTGSVPPWVHGQWRPGPFTLGPRRPEVLLPEGWSLPSDNDLRKCEPWDHAACALAWSRAACKRARADLLFGSLALHQNGHG